MSLVVVVVGDGEYETLYSVYIHQPNKADLGVHKFVTVSLSVRELPKCVLIRSRSHVFLNWYAVGAGNIE